MDPLPGNAPRRYSGLDIAALLTCAVITLGLWWRRSAVEIPGLGSRGTILLLMGVFVAAYFARMARDSDGHSRWCLAFTAVQAVAALALVYCVRGGSSPVLLIIVMAQAVALLPLPAFLLAAAAVNAVLWWMFAQIQPLFGATIEWLLFVGFQAFAALCSHYARSAEDASERLREVNAHLLATRSLLAESARDQERLRLARELHDVAGHKLTALKLNLAVLAREPALAARREIALAAQLSDELLGDIRGVVRQMRLHEGMDLRRAIEQLAAPIPRPRVLVEVAPDARVDSVAQAEAIVRAVQEALTNAARHANAEHVWVALRRDGDKVALSVRAEGRGGGALAFGSGLSGMRERLEALGGGLAVARGRDGGVALDAWLPLGGPA